jgi:hypothetical protein
MIAPQRQNTGRMKQLAFVGAPSALIEVFCHFGVGVVIEQLIDERQDLLRTASPLTDG